ncbi:MAG TPA: Mur ligase family protein, partial [Aggregicoccus sp.]|nr:Mur ligase family protein [Aggregicoccus sp.]
RPDVVVVGNVATKDHIEVAAAQERGLKLTSFPALLEDEFLKQGHALVVAGTHGKTTTSALAAFVLTHAGRDPSFLVGGVTRDFDSNFRLGEGPHFVVEGDEYDTAYWDKGSKFLHYRPRTAILTSVEFDHADIFRDLPHYEATFDKFVRLMPEGGRLAVCAAYPNAVALAKAAKSEVVTYVAKEGAQADYTPRGLRFGPEGAHFDVVEKGRNLGTVTLPMSGAHNVENALGVIAAARGLGLSFEEIAKGLASFSGVKRRQEVRAEVGGVMVVDDFAHHPTAVRETIQAIRHRYPQRRLWAIFEPRSNTSRRNIHQEDYAQAFAGAARASLKVPERHDKVPQGEELDVPRLVQALQAQGIQADGATEVPVMVEHAAKEARPGDVLLVMSNGAFGGFIDKLLPALRARMGEQ